MKKRLYSTLIYCTATLFTALWFAVCLAGFKPAPLPLVAKPLLPRATLCAQAAGPLRILHTPTLFALPSESGFSGDFPENKVNLKLALDRPKRTQNYLQTNSIARFRPEQPNLHEPILLPRPALTQPVITQPFGVPQPERIALFLSPELQARADKPPLLNLSGNLPKAIRIHLRIEPDGTVSQALFDEPDDNEQLAAAVRQLRFVPALNATDGWLELRFTEREDS